MLLRAHGNLTLGLMASVIDPSLGFTYGAPHNFIKTKIDDHT